MIHESVTRLCAKAFECRDSSPGGADAFDALYKTSESACVDFWENDVFETPAVEASVEAGRIEYNSDDAQTCLDDFQPDAVTCEQFWAGGSMLPAECRSAFVGTIADGEECTSEMDCAGPESRCQFSTDGSDTRTCG